MCGIIGCITNNEDAKNIVINGLKNLEYRGYDSCGIAIIETKTKDIKTIKAIGGVDELRKQNISIEGNIGIGHTRWATHGEVSIENTHPHIYKNISIAHNGIIENLPQIKEMLSQNKYKYSIKSTSDSPFIAILITFFMETMNMSFQEAFIKTVGETIKGTSAIIAISKTDPNIILIHTDSAPIYIAKNTNIKDLQTKIISSDMNSLQNFNKIYEVKNKEIIELSTEKASRISNHKNGKIKKHETLEFEDYKYNNTTEEFQKHQYKHITRSEIDQQKILMQKNIEAHISNESKILKETIQMCKKIKNIENATIVACGSSYNAGLIISHFLEEFAKIETSIHFASEYFPTKNKKNIKNNLVILISQSGETMDIIKAIERMDKNQKTLSIVNNPMGTIRKRATYNMKTIHSPEIGVAATKTFSSQVLTGLILSISMGQCKKTLSKKQVTEQIKILKETPTIMEETIKLMNEKTKAISEKISKSKDIIFIGKGKEGIGLAMEGSLKMKELSYIHSEAIPSGELKHGHIGIIDSSTTIIAISHDEFYKKKVISGLEESISRQAQGILIEYKDETEETNKKQTNIEKIMLSTKEKIHNIFSITAILQLLAYHTADKLKREIDKPRNLAKSITVE